MHKIIVVVPEETYRKAKIRAAELDTSVSALVRDFLEQVAQAESDFERRRRLQDEALATVTRFRAGDRLSREEARHRIAYWDPAILAEARALGCDVLLSEALTHGQSYDGVRVENPFRVRA